MTQSWVSICLLSVILFYSSFIILKVSAAECYDSCTNSSPIGPEWCLVSEMWIFREKVSF